jgi:hypothetical protein
MHDEIETDGYKTFEKIKEQLYDVLCLSNDTHCHTTKFVHSIILPPPLPAEKEKQELECIK